MKKVLLASTMLVATGGMAAAEITLSGFGRFGMYYEGNEGSDLNESRIEQRFRLNIDTSAETSSGVEVGARLRIETNENDNGRGQNAGLNTDDSGDFDGAGSNAVRAPEFYVRSGALNLFVGNTADVIDSGSVVDYYGHGVGLTSSIETSSGFNLPVVGSFSDDFEVSPTIKADYNVAGFTFAASYTDDAVKDSGDSYQVGVAYEFSGYKAGIVGGSQDDGAGHDNGYWAASLTGAVSTVNFSLLVADSDDQDDTSYGGSISVPVGAATEIRAVFAESGDDGADTGYGIGFDHNLGGGVFLRGGVGENKDGYGIADLGVVFDF